MKRKLNPIRSQLRLLTAVAMLLVGGALWLGTATPAQACPNCKGALPDSDDAQRNGKADVARGFAVSVVFMIAVPFAMIAAGGGAMWWLSKQAGIASLQIEQHTQSMGSASDLKDDAVSGNDTGTGTDLDS